MLIYSCIFFHNIFETVLITSYMLDLLINIIYVQALFLCISKIFLYALSLQVISKSMCKPTFFDIIM